MGFYYEGNEGREGLPSLLGQFSMTRSRILTQVALTRETYERSTIVGLCLLYKWSAADHAHSGDVCNSKR